MKLFLIIVSNELKPKNKLEEAVQKTLRDYDRQMFSEITIEREKQKILNKILFLNKKHPRCTPVKASFWCSYQHHDEKIKDYNLDVGGFISFSFRSSTDIDKEVSSPKYLH